MTTRIFLTLCFLLTLTRVQAQDAALEYKLPDATGQIVSDFGGLLTPKEVETLAKKIRPFYDSTSSQLAIVTVPIAWRDDEAIETYANSLFKKWKLGAKGKDNGVLFLIVGSINDVKLNVKGRGLRFEVGYGLEGALPDALCKQIQSLLVVPAMKGGNYFKAIDAGTDAILSAIKNEYHEPPKPTPVTTAHILDAAGWLTAAECEALEKKLVKSYLDKPLKIITGDLPPPDEWKKNIKLKFSKPVYIERTIDTATRAVSVKPWTGSSTVAIDAPYENPGVEFTERWAIEKEAATQLETLSRYEALSRTVDAVQDGIWRNVYPPLRLLTVMLLCSIGLVFLWRAPVSKKKKLATYKQRKVFTIALLWIALPASVAGFPLPLGWMWAAFWLQGYAEWAFWACQFLICGGAIGLFALAMMTAEKYGIDLSSGSGGGGSYAIGSGSSGSSSSASSSSSSSSYSSGSSSSGSSSSSNSGYYGGGGSSGGGGASSSW